MNHTNEPWRLTDDGTFVEVMAGEKTVLPAIRKSEAGDDFRRIVACVNACEGLATELLEKIVALGGTLPRRLEAMTNWERSEAEKQRDELMAALKDSLRISFLVSCQAGVVGRCECGDCITKRIDLIIAKAEG
jgi:hypothetical protein